MSHAADADWNDPIAPRSSAAAADIVGQSPAFTAMLDQLRRIARSEAPVLIEGETGSGKELAARFIHYGGARSSGPFVPVNCGALPDHLIEAELFGHERGAFTDARTARRGLVAEANGGTLFLDEVDALSTKAQIALLRFLQDQHYRPLGSSRELSTRVRVVAASNQGLDELVQCGRFRADLLYRLKILELTLPPLRARVGDARRLAQHFAQVYSVKYGIPPRGFDAATLVWIDSYPWPGNVRELENWVQRALLMADGPLLVADGPSISGSSCLPASDAVMQFQRAKAEAVRRFERDYVMRVLQQAQGNVTRAAQLAGKDRRAFGKLVKKYGIDRLAPSE